MTSANESQRPAPKTIDAKTFWRALGERAIGATIVTARGADGPAGFLGLSATHVCADPPTMLVSIDRKTSALAAVLHGRHFAINYLGRDAQAVADAFGGKTAAKGADRFEPGRWGSLTSGAPVFNDALGVLDCVLEQNRRVPRDHNRHWPRGRGDRAWQRRSADLFPRQLAEDLTSPRKALFRRHLRGLDELRHPLSGGVSRLCRYIASNSSRREGIVDGRASSASLHALSRGNFSMWPSLYPVEEDVALQERCVGRIHQRVCGTVEEGPAALLLERLLQALERLGIFPPPCCSRPRCRHRRSRSPRPRRSADSRSRPGSRRARPDPRDAAAADRFVQVLGDGVQFEQRHLVVDAQHRHFLVRRNREEPIGPIVGLDVAEFIRDFFSRSTIAARCTQGQVLKLTSRYFAMTSSFLFFPHRHSRMLVVRVPRPDSPPRPTTANVSATYGPFDQLHARLDRHLELLAPGRISDRTRTGRCGCRTPSRAKGSARTRPAATRR